jgi:alkylation response protein AidB-like acyl-CoA dehydrogenase
MEPFIIKRGDTSPALRYALAPSSVSLLGTAVLFKMRGPSGVVVDRAATIITATGTPTVEHAWLADDTAAAGFFSAEFEVTYGDGAIETFPNNGFISVHITEDIR